MDAAPHLIRIADALAAAKLEAILIGNAGAALNGAPVTTLDFDFFYRDTPANQAKLRIVAEELGASLTQPFPALSTVFRIEHAESELQIDFTSQVHGVSSFNSLRSRAVRADFKGRSVLVAALGDIIKSKRAANRPKDIAVLHVLDHTLKEQQNAQANQARTGAGDHAPKQ
ncbi:MAG: hypothetical protein FJW30_30045 [Acidobacteria bacterium]|nr:hypothetical protein [Acidobacteriota bacterium]